MSYQFPRTTVGGVSLSRMVMGTNWMAGWSHRSPSADQFIKDYHGQEGHSEAVIDAYLEYGVDTIVGLFTNPVSKPIVRAINTAREKHGKDIIMIDTPVLNMDDSPAARKEAEAEIKRSKETGARFCLIHHRSAEQLVNKNKGTMDRLSDYLAMIRDHGMIPGLSAHMPELIVYADNNEYDVETYIQLYNPMGFLMQVEIESVARIIWNAKKPVLTIKPMAAGRTTPYVGLNFSWATIRPSDMVAVGCMRPEEVHEDVEISRAAFEHRFPDIGARNSPNQNQTAITGKA
jgi:hypothetical protein